MQLMWPILGLFIALAVIVVAVTAFQAAVGKGPTPEFPYEKEESLFTPAERSFLAALEEAVGERYRIFGKVRLSDVIRVRKGLDRSKWQSAFNKTQSKHLDFVVVDPRDLSIQFVVELDDKSHERAKRQERDAFVNQALEAAGVRLVRVPAKASYSAPQLRAKLLEPSATAPPAPAPAPSPAPAKAKGTVSERLKRL